MVGKVLSINISRHKGEKKRQILSARLIENFGIEGDAHAGSSIRQVSMLFESDIKRMKERGLEIGFGDFAENITADMNGDINIVIGTRILINDCLLEVTQIGKDCHTRCNIFKQVGFCVMPESGIFMKVISGGEIKIGDNIWIINNSETKG
ncbi:MAG: MOSC domain-containing protein [Myxococcota bacterium]